MTVEEGGWVRLRVRRPKDFASGLLYIVLGVTAFSLSRSYEMGTPLRMGPGFFPAAISLLLLALGIGAFVQALVSREFQTIEKYGIEPLLLLTAGVLSFAFLIQRAGLFAAIAALMFFACFKRLLTNPIEVLLVYLALAGFSALVFVYLFGISLPLLPSN